MIRHIEAEVRMSEMHTQRVAVPAWEFPVLQAVHGNGAQETGERFVERDAPDAADEFQRLANKYRSAEGSTTPFVAQVYGAFGPGLASLKKEIDAASAKPKAARKRAPAKIDETDPLVA